MNPYVAIGLAVAVVLVGLAAWQTKACWDRHRQLLAKEKASGNMRVRSVMAHRVGRRNNPERMRYVCKAQYLRGWVFITQSRAPGQKFTEYVGWAPTKRGAERKYREYVNGGRRTRSERGDITDVVLIVGCVLLLAYVAPNVIDKIFSAELSAWLQETAHDLWAWLRGIFK